MKLKNIQWNHINVMLKDLGIQYVCVIHYVWIFSKLCWKIWGFNMFVLYIMSEFSQSYVERFGDSICLCCTLCLNFIKVVLKDWGFNIHVTVMHHAWFIQVILKYWGLNMFVLYILPVSWRINLTLFCLSLISKQQWRPKQGRYLSAAFHLTVMKRCWKSSLNSLEK